MKRWKEKLVAVCEYCVVVIMEDAQRVRLCGWEYPTLKSASELKKLFEIMRLVIVNGVTLCPAAGYLKLKSWMPGTQKMLHRAAGYLRYKS